MLVNQVVKINRSSVVLASLGCVVYSVCTPTSRQLAAVNGGDSIHCYRSAHIHRPKLFVAAFATYLFTARVALAQPSLPPLPPLLILPLPSNTSIQRQAVLPYFILIYSRF